MWHPAKSEMKTAGKDVRDRRGRAYTPDDGDLFLVLLLGLYHLASTVEAVRTDVVPTVHLARGGLDGQGRRLESVV
jgi:hypothetical protein